MIQLNLKIVITFLFLSCFSFGQVDSLGLKRCIPNPDTYKRQKVYRTVDKMPEYMHGMAGFSKYIMKNVHFGYGDERYKSIIHTTFIIDTLGHVQDVCTITNKTELSNDEKQIKEIIEKSPAWTPGQLNGVRVCVRLTIPLRVCIK